VRATLVYTRQNEGEFSGDTGGAEPFPNQEALKGGLLIAWGVGGPDAGIFRWRRPLPRKEEEKETNEGKEAVALTSGERGK